MSEPRRFLLRPLNSSDVAEYTEMLHASFNAWYWKHGWGKDYFTCRPGDTSIFYEIYNDLTPGCGVAAVASGDGRLAGACFYHPRPRHVSLGIMAVHPDCGGQGIGRALVDFILRFTLERGHDACRLVGSAMNMDSFSLYNRSGFVPRCAYHDMVLAVPEELPSGMQVAGEDRVRDAELGDVATMADVEMEVSAIHREVDYRYAIENPRGILHASVCDDGGRGIEGFMISIRHPAIAMLGPCVARSEDAAIALVRRELERFHGSSVLLLAPMEKRKMVERFYDWGAVNVESHLTQVWGAFQPYRGVNMPGFLPETG